MNERRFRVARPLTIAGSLAVAALAWGSLWPMGGDLAAAPPVRLDRASALARFDSLARLEPAALHPDCAPVVLERPGRGGRAWVMLHGLTSCPRQFRALAESLHARGDHVVIPRLPRHGHADRMTASLAELTARELAAATAAALDLAAALGDTVEVMGLSVGATAAAWAAQERPDVHRVVLLSPMIGAAGVPGWLDPLLARALVTLPNRFAWWDGEAREALAGPGATYPRFASRALGESLRLGRIVLERARREAPGASSVVVITTEDDRAASAAATAALVRAWRRHGARVETHVFPKPLGIEHDFVDPEQPFANVAVAYDSLFRWIDGGR